MNFRDLLIDSFSRVPEALAACLKDLTPDELLWSPAQKANHIAWLAWHIGRCEDAQMAALTGRDEVYIAGWVDRFALPYEPGEIGYGHSPEQVHAFSCTDTQLLQGYYVAVAAQTRDIIRGLDDLDRILDDPYRVSVGTRVVSIVNDVWQHVGQAAYLRGLIREE